MDVLQLVRDRVKKKYVNRDALRANQDQSGLWCVMCKLRFDSEANFVDHKTKYHKLKFGQ